MIKNINYIKYVALETKFSILSFIGNKNQRRINMPHKGFSCGWEDYIKENIIKIFAISGSLQLGIETYE